MSILVTSLKPKMTGRRNSNKRSTRILKYYSSSLLLEYYSNTRALAAALLIAEPIAAARIFGQNLWTQNFRIRTSLV